MLKTDISRTAPTYSRAVNVCCEDFVLFIDVVLHGHGSLSDIKVPNVAYLFITISRFSKQRLRVVRKSPKKSFKKRAALDHHRDHYFAEVAFTVSNTYSRVEAPNLRTSPFLS